MTEEDADELTEIPVDGMTVDLDRFRGVVPDGSYAAVNDVESLVTPMLNLLGAVGRASTVNQIWRHEVVVIVRFREMTGRLVGDLIDLADTTRSLLLAVARASPNARSPPV